MNKILKRTLIITGVIVGLLVLAFVGMALKLKSEMSEFTPMETGHIVDNIFVVKDDFTNVFIVQDDTQYIVIDCANNPATVEEQMKSLGINPNDVVAVLLTHTDGDHVGALGLFDNAKLYMSKEEEKMINGEKSKFLWFGNSLPRTDYILLEDREVVQIGNLKIEGILVPGHTSGMMAYLINDKYLFTGDILSLKDGKIAPIPAFFDMDNAQAIASREIIRHIPTAEYIFTAHWGFTDNYQVAIDAAHNSQNSLDWAGTYTGVIPCADCEGISVSLTLHPDETYLLSYSYLGKGNSFPIMISGKFSWNEAGSTIFLNDAKGFPPYYIVGENRLIQLDMEGNPITGALADKYVLEKNIECSLPE